MTVSRHTALTLVAIVVLLVVCGVYIRTVAFDDDEFQHAHVAWLIRHGHVPHADFFEHHFTAYHALLSAVFLPGGPSTLFVFRAVSLVCLLGALVLVYRTARRFCGDGTVPFLAVILAAGAPVFVMKMLEVRPAAPALLCTTAAAALLLRPRSPRRISILVFAGILTGLSVVFSAKFVFAAAGLFAAAWILHGAAAAGILAASAFLPAVPFLLWLGAGGALRPFVEETILLNLRWKRSFPPTGYLVETFTTSGTLAVLGVLGILRLMVAPGQRRTGTALAVLLGGGLLGVFMVPVPFRQVFLPLFPVLALGAAALLARIRDGLTDRRGRAAACVVLLAAAVLPGIQRLADELEHTNATDLALMHTVEQHDGFGPVFDGRGLMFYRPHVGRHACMHEGILMMLDRETYAADVIESLKREKYPTVIMDYRVAKMPTPIHDFITRHYRPLPGTPLRVPGLALDRSQLLRGARASLPVNGTYRASWTGGAMTIDGAPLARGTPVQLTAGDHVFKADGFVTRFELVLVKR